MFWWESFKLPPRFVDFKDGNGFQKIADYVPDTREVVWFVVDEGRNLPFCSIYEMSIDNIINVVSEYYFYDEYYIEPVRVGQLFIPQVFTMNLFT